MKLKIQPPFPMVPPVSFRLSRPWLGSQLGAKNSVPSSAAGAGVTIEKLMDCKLPCSPSPKTLAFSQHAACQVTEMPAVDVEVTLIDAVALV